MTAELEQRARALLDDIESRGGMLRAIADGWVQQQIHEAAWSWQQDVEAGARVVVGVNRFGDDEAVPAPPFRHDDRVERARNEFLADWRASRPRRPCESALRELETAARGDANLVPPILSALTARATLGEVCDTMRRVFGVHQPGSSL